MDDTRTALGHASRTLLGLSTGLLAGGFSATALALWSLFGSSDDGGGADIGGGILALFGTVVGCIGLVLLAVTAVVAISARRRLADRVSGRAAPGRGTT